MKVALSTLLLVGSLTPALALPQVGFSAPEISALDGTAALAVVGAVVLMVWERRRRAK